LVALEIGCGTGAQLWYLQHEGHLAVGIDRSIVGLRQASDRLRSERQREALALSDAAALPVRGEAFDLVIEVEAFSCNHEDRSRRLWREAARVLRPGGQFVSVAFTPSTHGSQLGERVGERTVIGIPEGPLADIGLVSFINEDDVHTLAAEAGLAIEDVQLRSWTTGPDRWLVDELIVVAQRPL